MAYKFEDKFVRFRWRDELAGKKCFFADNIEELEASVREGKLKPCLDKHSDNFPFETEDDFFTLCYYDPNYEVKLAYEEGKQIQISGDGETWVDWEDERDPDWNSLFLFRIKPVKSALKCTEEEQRLKWTDLDVGDVIETFEGTHRRKMVTAIDYEDKNNLHIYCNGWLNDNSLLLWRKVNANE